MKNIDAVDQATRDFLGTLEAAYAGKVSEVMDRELNLLDACRVSAHYMAVDGLLDGEKADEIFDFYKEKVDEMYKKCSLIKDVSYLYETKDRQYNPFLRYRSLSADQIAEAMAIISSYED